MSLRWSALAGDEAAEARLLLGGEQRLEVRNLGRLRQGLGLGWDMGCVWGCEWCIPL